MSEFQPSEMAAGSDDSAVSAAGRLIVLGIPQSPHTLDVLAALHERFHVELPESIKDGLQALQNDDTACVLFAGSLQHGEDWLLNTRGMLDQIPEGVALLDANLCVVWHNAQFRKYCPATDDCDGPLYDALGLEKSPSSRECVLAAALAGDPMPARTLRVREGRYYELQAQRLVDERQIVDQPHLLVIVRDVSERENNRQKFNAIYQAGLDLGDLSPVDVTQLSPQERIELLKMKILHYTKDVMQYDTIEIRLYDQQTGRLTSLLQVGMEPQAVERELFASTEGNGVTGFVAATGKSYLCRDITTDPLYLTGARDARSSLTVPLILHEEVLGTFNVESPETDAFDNQDLQFLELFGKEIASALNTLDLLAVEQLATVAESTQLVLKEVATPVDQILNESAWILARYIGRDNELCERLQRVLDDARKIRQLIHKAGESLSECESPHAPLPSRPGRPRLRGKRVLVVDQEAAVRQTAHEFLERYGCEVETAHHGEEACLMARSFPYDAVIADIRLPDMNGFECFTKLKALNPALPIILLTGFGYDPTHSIVKARQQGLQGVLYKPFKLDQLLEEVEKAVSA